MLSSHSISPSHRRPRSRRPLAVRIPGERTVVADYGFERSRGAPRAPATARCASGSSARSRGTKACTCCSTLCGACPPARSRAGGGRLRRLSLITWRSLRRLADRPAGHVHGPVRTRDAAAMYAELDVVVVPSLWPENSPLVIHEAFMTGVPVVAARTGGIPALVRDERLRPAFRSRGPDTLTDALTRLLEEPALHGGSRGRVPAGTFDRAGCDEWDARYRRVIDLRGPASRVIPPRISIVLPTRNGMATLPAVFEAVRAQETAFTFEIRRHRLRIDRRHARVPAAPRRSHVDDPAGPLRSRADTECRDGGGAGRARRSARAGRRARRAHVADGARCPTRADPQFAGTFARQLPRPEASAITRRYLANWVTGGEARRTVSLTSDELDQLAPLQRLDRCAFDHVCAAIRRAVWLRHPYRPTPIGEDVEWAREVLLAGHRRPPSCRTRSCSIWHHRGAQDQIDARAHTCSIIACTSCSACGPSHTAGARAGGGLDDFGGTIGGAARLGGAPRCRCFGHRASGRCRAPARSIPRGGGRGARQIDSLVAGVDTRTPLISWCTAFRPKRTGPAPRALRQVHRADARGRRRHRPGAGAREQRRAPRIHACARRIVRATASCVGSTTRSARASRLTRRGARRASRRRCLRAVSRRSRRTWRTCITSRAV